MRQRPTDWDEILADRGSRISYYNAIWILSQFIEQFQQEFKVANKILAEDPRDIPDKNYRFSNNIPDRKSNVEELGNDYYSQNETANYLGPNFCSERQLLCEAIVTKKEVRIITELPGVSEENLAINVYPSKLVLIAAGEGENYCEIFNLPDKTDTNLWKKSFSNGFLEIIFKTKSD